ncbi:MAG TPA: Rpp14/Pop5 family protein [Candidatus Nanoarchaeia archaeon]|nr:Rpp14/Pop5 family protein [Candidatus Nanoarchaeia archaeon]
MKQKLLKPSLREKKRYLVYEVISEGNIEYKKLKEEVTEKFREYFGNFTLSKANLNFLEFQKNRGVIKLNNKYLDHLRASFCFVRKINKEDILLRSLGASGMINKSRSKFLHRGAS